MIIQQIELVKKFIDIKNIHELPEYLLKKFGNQLIRWYVSKIEDNQISVELSLDINSQKDSLNKQESNFYITSNNCVAINIVPTGIGCNYGGFAADAAPVNQLLAKCVDYLICNPNIVNASNFINIQSNVIYTEGYMLDQFCSNKITLYRPYTINIGLIIEKTTKDNLEYILNVVNAIKTIYGVNITEYIMTDKDFGAQCKKTESGAYAGEVQHESVILDACKTLIDKGVNAIAITTNIKGLPLDDYEDHFLGNHPNPIGGVEAIISHLITKEFNIPSAHAPMINFKDNPLMSTAVDPRSAGEYTSKSGLACILIGLMNSLLPYNNSVSSKFIVPFSNLLAVVAPATALGGIPMIYASKYNIPIIAVKDNTSILNVNKDKLGINNVIEVNNYLEAAGILLSLKEGLNPDSLLRPIKGFIS